MLKVQLFPHGEIFAYHRVRGIENGPFRRTGGFIKKQTICKCALTAECVHSLKAAAPARSRSAILFFYDRRIINIDLLDRKLLIIPTDNSYRVAHLYECCESQKYLNVRLDQQAELPRASSFSRGRYSQANIYGKTPRRASCSAVRLSNARPFLLRRSPLQACKRASLGIGRHPTNVPSHMYRANVRLLRATTEFCEFCEIH